MLGSGRLGRGRLGGGRLISSGGGLSGGSGGLGGGGGRLSGGSGRLGSGRNRLSGGKLGRGTLGSGRLGGSSRGGVGGNNELGGGLRQKVAPRDAGGKPGCCRCRSVLWLEGWGCWPQRRADLPPVGGAVCPSWPLLRRRPRLPYPLPLLRSAPHVHADTWAEAAQPGRCRQDGLRQCCRQAEACAPAAAAAKWAVADRACVACCCWQPDECRDGQEGRLHGRQRAVHRDVEAEDR
jgi:hypothetical protein